MLVEIFDLRYSSFPLRWYAMLLLCDAIDDKLFVVLDEQVDIDIALLLLLMCVGCCTDAIVKVCAKYFSSGFFV